MTTKVLFVDDEPNVLAGLRRMLRGQRKVWDMHFANGGQAALDMARRKVIRCCCQRHAYAGCRWRRAAYESI